MGGVEAGCEVAPGSDVAPGMNVCKGSTLDVPSGHAQAEADSEMAFSHASFINGLMGQIRRSTGPQLVDMGNAKHWGQGNILLAPHLSLPSSC